MGQAIAATNHVLDRFFANGCIAATLGDNFCEFLDADERA